MGILQVFFGLVIFSLYLTTFICICLLTDKFFDLKNINEPFTSNIKEQFFATPPPSITQTQPANTDPIVINYIPIDPVTGKPYVIEDDNRKVITLNGKLETNAIKMSLIISIFLIILSAFPLFKMVSYLP